MDLNKTTTVLKITDDHPERFLISWTLAGGGPKQHEHDDYHKNVYFAYFQPRNEHFFSVDGIDLGTSINDRIAEKHCLVHNTGALGKFHQAVGLNPNPYFDLRSGNPIVVFHDNIRNTYVIARWTRKKWSLSDFPTKLNDMENTSFGSLVIYSSSGKKINLYESTDGGVKWVLKDMIPTSIHLDQLFIIDDHNPELVLLGADMSAYDDTDDRHLTLGPVFGIGLSGQAQ